MAASSSPDRDAALKALLPQAVAGDRDALSQLLFSQFDRLTAFVRSKMDSSLTGVISAEDIVQQAMLKAHKAIDRFEGSSIAAFAGWLNTIAHNQLRDYGRRRVNERLDASVRQPGEAKQNDDGGAYLRLSQMEDVRGGTPMESAMGSELTRYTQVAMASLPENYQLALSLKYLQGLSMAETAERMGVTEDAARGICHRAKKQLKMELVRLSRFR